MLLDFYANMLQYILGANMRYFKVPEPMFISIFNFVTIAKQSNFSYNEVSAFIDELRKIPAIEDVQVSQAGKPGNHVNSSENEHEVNA